MTIHLRWAGALTLTICANPLAAQVMLDGTLGPRGLLSGPNYAIPAEVGQQHGGNLFHSFGQFSIYRGESATFSGPNSVNNIIGRVTGGQASSIDGLLRSTIPGANLYLLNPAGVLFGEKARLDVSGSFHASTADYVRLNDGGRFDAVYPDHSVLTVAPIEAFGFLDPAPGPITVQGSVLQVPEGQTLSLLGGDLTVVNGTLYAPAGRLNLAAVGSVGEIVPTAQGLELRGFGQLGTFALTHTAEQPRPTVNLGVSYDPVVLGDLDTSGAGGGDIFIRGGRWWNQDGWVFADTYGERQGGQVNVGLDGEMRFTSSDASQELDARITTATVAAGRAGDIVLDVGMLNLQDGSVLFTNAWEQSSGDAGDITVTAREAVIINGVNDQDIPSGLVANALIFSQGDAGDIRVTTPVLTLSQGGVIQSVTRGRGRGGNVTLKADVLTIDSGAYLSTATNDAQDAGTIRLDVGALTLAGDGQINTITSGSGDSGDLLINARDAIVITGVDSVFVFSSSGLHASALTGGGGQAGHIQVTTPRLTLDQGGVISAYSERTSGGEIVLQVDHLKLLNHSGITSSVQGDQFSDGGNITLHSVNVAVLNGSRIIAQANQGRGGVIQANTKVFLHNAANIGEVLNASSEVEGNDGSIELNAPMTDISGNLTSLPVQYLDLSAQLKSNCEVSEADERGHFFMRRGGLPPSPDQPLGSGLVGRCMPIANTAPTVLKTVIAPEPAASSIGFGNR